MKTISAFVASAVVLGAALSAVAVERHVVRSGKPAADDIVGWESESYPIGNGWFGVNVFGGVECERLQVTETVPSPAGVSTQSCPKGATSSLIFSPQLLQV